MKFRGDAGPTYVTITPRTCKKSLDAFLNVRATGKKKVGRRRQRRRARSRKQKVRTSPGLAAGDGQRPPPAEDHVAKASARAARFPLYFPSRGVARAPTSATARACTTSTTAATTSTAPTGWSSSAGLFGQYYGVQGTNWKAPPILDDPSESCRPAGASTSSTTTATACGSWRGSTPRAVYWVSNTLSETLSNRQMLAIARSLTYVGASG